MNNLTISELTAAFEEWDFSKDEDALIAVPKNAEVSREVIPEILEQLFKAMPKENFSIQVSELPVLKIAATVCKEVKYHRMYTSGCFDIFHYGHLNILKKTKELCDYLIVGVSTDELIEKEKGKRPVIPFEERKRVIEAVRYVDEVIAQEDKNKQKIVDTYKIDAISVGDDWRGKYPPVSCAMEYFPYTANVSSTVLKNTLQLITK